MKAFIVLMRLVFCRHDWRDSVDQLAPMGMKAERCRKCTALRRVYVKSLVK